MSRMMKRMSANRAGEILLSRKKKKHELSQTFNCLQINTLGFLKYLPL